MKRRITDKYGKTYSEDMQVTTGNAASAIAFRNAVLKVVPKAVTKRVINEVKDVAVGRSMDLESRRQNMLAYYAKIGVTEAEILNYCGVKAVADIDAQMIFELSGLKNAIKEGTTTVQETFKANTADAEKQAEAARKQAEEAKEKLEKAEAKYGPAYKTAEAKRDALKETVENYKKAVDEKVYKIYVGIRPEGFIYNEKGVLTLDLQNVEVMGRDVSIVSTHDNLLNDSGTIRSIINAENEVDTTAATVRFGLKKNKVFIFDADTEERIYF